MTKIITTPKERIEVTLMFWLVAMLILSAAIYDSGLANIQLVFIHIILVLSASLFIVRGKKLNNITKRYLLVNSLFTLYFIGWILSFILSYVAFEPIVLVFAILTFLLFSYVSKKKQTEYFENKTILDGVKLT